MKTLFMHPDVVRAMDFAIRIHDVQTRKDGSTLYITHPIGVAALVELYNGTINQIITAILHDTVEDCECDREMIEAEFGPRVAEMVANLTNTSKQDAPTLNRAARKELDAQRLADIDLESQLVKLCDIYYNICDMKGLDPGFKVKFLKEKQYQTEVMTSKWNHADPSPNMWRLRKEILNEIDYKLTTGDFK